MNKNNENQLWVQSMSTSDVSLSDLGVKVPAGKTVNVYKVNPYLTVSQVEKSLGSGVLFRRLELKVIRVVADRVSTVPAILKLLKESKTPVHARKTKTSVVIESDADDADEQGSFDFADYGVTDLGPVSQDRQDNSVMVNVKQDNPVEPEEGLKMEPEVESGISKQSQIVMKVTQDAMVDPTGPFADASESSASKPFTVVEPPKVHEEEPEVVSPTGKTVSNDSAGAVIVGEKQEVRSLKTVKQAQEEGKDCSLPGDDEVGADKAVDLEETEFDSKVATKTTDGAVIMKLKETEPE